MEKDDSDVAYVIGWCRAAGIAVTIHHSGAIVLQNGGRFRKEIGGTEARRRIESALNQGGPDGQ